MKTISLPLILALIVVAMSSCSSDETAEIHYGVYATADLLAMTTQEITVTGSGLKTDTQVLTTGDFDAVPLYSLPTTIELLFYNGSPIHFDRFGVESTVKVTYRMREGIDLTKMKGVVVMAHGFAGIVNTKDKDDETSVALVLTTPESEVFILPADAGALQTYLIDLGETPDVATVTIDGAGKPIVAAR